MTGPAEHRPESRENRAAFRRNLDKVYGWYTGGFVAFVLVLAVLEQFGLSRRWIGIVFLLGDDDRLGADSGAGQRDAAQRFSLKPVRFQGVNTPQMLADFHALPG